MMSSNSSTNNIDGRSKRRRHRRCLGLLSSRNATLALAVVALLIHSRVFVWLSRISLVHLHHHDGQAAGHHQHPLFANTATADSFLFDWHFEDVQDLNALLSPAVDRPGLLPPPPPASLAGASSSHSQDAGDATDPFFPSLVLDHAPPKAAFNPRPLRFNRQPLESGASTSPRSAWRKLSFNIVPVHSRLTSPDITTADVSERRRWKAIRWLVRAARVYFAVGALCAAAGVAGVLKSNLRLTRLFLAHSALDFLLTSLCSATFLLLFTSPTLRAAICEGFASGAKMQDWWLANTSAANAASGGAASAEGAAAARGSAAEAVAAATATAVAAATRYQQQLLQRQRLRGAALQQQKYAQHGMLALQDDFDASSVGASPASPLSTADAPVTATTIVPCPPSVDALLEQTLVFFGPDSNCDDSLIQIALPACLCLILLYTTLRIHLLICVNRFVARLWRSECARQGIYTGRGSLLPLVRSTSTRKSPARGWNWSSLARWTGWWTERRRTRGTLFLGAELIQSEKGNADFLAVPLCSSESDSSDSDSRPRLGSSLLSDDTSSSAASSSTSSTPRSTTPLSITSDSSSSSKSTMSSGTGAAGHLALTLGLLRAVAAVVADAASSAAASAGAGRSRARNRTRLADLDEEAQPILGGMDVVTIRRPALAPPPKRE